MHLVPVPFLVIGFAALLVAVERLRPGRKFPPVATWWLRAAVLNSFQVASAFIGPATWDRWMDGRRWFELDLPVALEAGIGYVAITFIYYWWHRWRHQVPFLWRWFHQVHHSPQRIEIITSFYKHPFEILFNGVLSSAILYFLIGVAPASAGLAVLATGIAELFYHWNIKTPYWLGFLIQRPESHCVHHQEGLHSYNFGDLPVWDWMFGTLRNPRRWELTCGFGDGEHRLARMLCGRDVSTPASEHVPVRAQVRP